ncbi:MAG: feruloyl-CoA synthase [Alphaproteobacteria bacterium]|nr:feruloyl-CoA synthase [Alphaproteobacteria bacterium]
MEKVSRVTARRHLPFLSPDIGCERRGDGVVRLWSRTPLGDYPATLLESLAHWAAMTPERTALAERSEPGWRRMTFAELRERARRVAQGLIARGLGPDRPVMLLSGNGLEHAVLTIAGLYAGVPVCPVSPAYSLMSEDFAKLRHIGAMVRPGLVWVTDDARFAAALDALDPVPRETDLTALEVEPTEALDRRRQALDGRSTAKILFTSGSTGRPKGVVVTHGMLAVNQRQLALIWPFLETRPPVLLDWLPWSHTFGGNQNLGLVLARGAALYIDDGRPTPDGIARTVENLRLVSPTLHFNVPRGLDMLLPYLEADVTLRDRFFAELDLIFYSGAALPEPLWQRLDALGVAATGQRPVLTTAWGATETAPLAMAAHFPLDRAGVVGVPVPGVEIALVPDGGKHEIRVRGPNVTPGYTHQPPRPTTAFDTDGFYRSGDAGSLADPADANAGLVFDGRIAEDFKLATGTWVSAGALRVAVVAAGAPVVQDAVIAGHDRDGVGVLLFAHPDAQRIVATVRAGLARHNTRYPGSSTRIARALILDEPPRLDADEITDKGYLNQRAVLSRRTEAVARLFAEPPGDAVIVF